MRAEVSQPPGLGPGFALVTVKEAPPLDPGSLEFSVENPPRGFLQESLEPPWGTTHAWLKPGAAIAGPDGLELTLGPERTWSMRPNVTYVLRLKDAATASPSIVRIAWKPIRMPSQPPERLPTSVPNLAVDTVAAMPPPSEAARGADALKETTPAPPISAQQPGRKPLRIALASLALLLLAGAGAAVWFVTRDKPTEIIATKPASVPEAAVGPLGPATARAFLRASPSADASYTEAARYMKDGSPEALQGALVLLSQAADNGSAPAQTALGRMYDPDTFAAGKSAMKAPDAEKALLWYERAAKSSYPEGLYRLGKLLMSGRASAPGLGPEQGATSLQRAAELGSTEAQAEINQLKKPAN
jgi:hypothetical protein